MYWHNDVVTLNIFQPTEVQSLYKVHVLLYAEVTMNKVQSTEVQSLYKVDVWLYAQVFQKIVTLDVLQSTQEH